MLIYFGLVGIGLVALIVGGDLLVRGAVAIAHRFCLSDALIGLTLVGFGTSMPELLVSVKASLAGQSGIALGNVVGSNTANILLIGGITLLIAPYRTQAGMIRRDILVALFAAAILLCAGWLGYLDRLFAALFLILLIAYLVYAYRADTATADDATPVDPTCEPDNSLPRSAFLVIAGFSLLFLGAGWLVDGAASIARVLHISEAVIGLTIVAVGTSLPELAASSMAALRRKPDIGLGNIVGSNIFNILGILGITGLIMPLPIAHTMASIDIPLMLVLTAIFAVMLFCLRKIGRVSALLMLGIYGGYIVFLFKFY